MNEFLGYVDSLVNYRKFPSLRNFVKFVNFVVDFHVALSKNFVNVIGGQANYRKFRKFRNFCKFSKIRNFPNFGRRTIVATL